MCLYGGELAQDWHRIGGDFVAVWKGVYRGVRYREHDTRMLGKGKGARPDRYFVVRYSVDGVMRQEGVGWESEGYSEVEVIQLLGQIRRNLREGTPPYSLAGMRDAERKRVDAERLAAIRAAGGAGGATFGVAARAWMEHTREALRSWDTDCGRLRNHVLPLWADVRLDALDVGHVGELARDLAKKKNAGGKVLSPQTVRHCVILAGRVLEFARTVPQGADRRPLLEGANPVHGFKLRRVDNTRWRILTEQETDAILEYCREHGGEMAAMYSVAVRIGLECGARLTEIVSIRREHFDHGMRRVRIVDTKNNDSRFIYPPDGLFHDMLGLLAASPDSPWLFPSPVVSGERIWKSAVGHFFARACDALGINEGVDDRRGKVVFHTLRHTYGTRQIMAGTNPLTLKRLLGHRSLSTTERYVHLAEEFVAGARK